MSSDELDRTIPVKPPTVNKKINPRAHSMAGDHLILPPCKVASQLVLSREAKRDGCWS